MPNTEVETSRRERGVHYPADNIEAAVEMLGRLREAIGFGAASRETIAEALGYRGITGTSARRIGSLTHYDLLERVGGGAYRISDLGRRILMPTSETERHEAISEAAKRPALFGALLQKYEGHALPTMLPNLLIREHGISTSASEQAAQTFRETVEYSGFLRNGILNTTPSVHPTSRLSDEAGDEDALESVGPRPSTHIAPPVNSTQQSQPAVNIQSYTIPLDSSGRVAMVSIPVPVLPRDIRRIRIWTEYLSSVFADEEDEYNAVDG